MLPTMQFRWFSTSNEVTAEMVRAGVERSGDATMVCKTRLAATTKPVLQQWFVVEGWEHQDYIDEGGVWEDVPFVVEKTPNVTVSGWPRTD